MVLRLKAPAASSEHVPGAASEAALAWRRTAGAGILAGCAFDLGGTLADDGGQHRVRSVIPNDVQQVAATATKGLEIAGMGIAPEHLPHPPSMQLIQSS
jgi:hypothetical protein